MMYQLTQKALETAPTWGEHENVSHVLAMALYWNLPERFTPTQMVEVMDSVIRNRPELRVHIRGAGHYQRYFVRNGYLVRVE